MTDNNGSASRESDPNESSFEDKQSRDAQDGGSRAEEDLHELVRTQDFDTPHAIEIDVGNSTGPILIELAETALTHVEVRHDPSSGTFDWRGGLTGLLSWVTEQFGEAGIRSGVQTRATNLRGMGGMERGAKEPIAEAVRQTRIELTGNRLSIRPPGSMPLRTVPLAIKVQAPVQSQIGVRTGSGEVTINGEAGRVQVQAGSGSVSTDRVSGSATVRTGSGRVRLGGVGAGLQARSGSGDVEVGSVDAPSSLVTGSGNVWLGTVSGDVLVRSGSGDITLADAVSGQAELITGSGELQISVRQGVSAEVDLTSSTGAANSDLSVADEPPGEEPALRIFGRTGSGDALITSAVT